MIAKHILYWAKRLCGRHQNEYYVPVKDIIIQPSFLQTRIRPGKWKRKKQYYLDHGIFESQVVLDKNFVLQDGYSTYKLAKEFKVKHVPVVFIEGGNSK